MIQIINITGNPIGNNMYKIKINNKVIASFIHKYEEGLSVCLKKASEAVEKQKWIDAYKLLNQIK